MVFEPKILILDEATAHLDSQTEQLVQNALQTVSEGRTTLIIAHAGYRRSCTPTASWS